MSHFIAIIPLPHFASKSLLLELLLFESFLSSRSFFERLFSFLYCTTTTTGLEASALPPGFLLIFGLHGRACSWLSLPSYLTFRQSFSASVLDSASARRPCARAA